MKRSLVVGMALAVGLGLASARAEEAAKPDAAKVEKGQKVYADKHCSMCHSDFTDIVAFTPKADSALQRVRSGDMPRCTGGVPCPADQHLTADQYAVLEGWIRGGEQP